MMCINRCSKRYIMDTFSMISTLTYKKCLQFFDDISMIPYAIIKGEALSVQAYGKTGQRFCSDIDVLIPRNHLNSIERELETNGLKNTLQTRKDKGYELNIFHCYQ